MGPTLDQSRFAALLSDMNDVAIGHGSWLNILEQVGDIFSAPIATLELIDKQNGSLRFLSTCTIPEPEQRHYEERIHKINPRFALLPISAPGQVRADRHLPRATDEGATEYYDWLTRSVPARYFAGAMLFDDRDFMALASVHFPQSKGPTDSSVEAQFGRLVPYIANALKVEQALASSQNGLGALSESALGDDLRFALVDSKGRLLDMSAEFERTVARSDALCIHDRRIRAEHPGSNERISKMLRSLLMLTSEATAVVARIERLSGGHGFLLRGIRLAHGRELFGRLRPAALIVLVDLDAPAANIARELRDGWGLSRREAELAILVGDGHSVEQAASQLGISAATARFHLKGVYRRLDIGRQADLVRLVTRLGS